MQENPNAAIARWQWLVSVRDLAEATTAAGFGVDILDLKEPLDGPLAPVSPQTWKSVANWNQTQSGDRQLRPELSAALGESHQAMLIARNLPPEFAYAKVGPSDCNNQSQLTNLWSTLRALLPPSVQLVAVAYADHHAARSLPAIDILHAAARQGFDRILLDTFGKTERSSIDLMTPTRLIEFGTLARKHGLWWSLAGSVKLQQLSRLEQLLGEKQSSPDCVAIRGDVCDGGRGGNVSCDRLRAWQQALAK